MGSSAGRVALAATVVVALSGCGFTRSPADGLQFQAPAGWKSSMGIMGFMQFWRSPTDDREVLMLIRSPKPLNPKDVFASGTMKNATVTALRTIAICGGRPATYLEAQGSSTLRGRDDAQMVMSNIGGSAYFALYVRPLGTPPNPEASAAIRELCAKP